MQEIVDTLQTLISYKTTADNTLVFNETIQFVEEFFKNSKLKVHVLSWNNVPTLYISKSGNITPDILLQGHLDVVDGDEKQFTPFIEGNKLIGRGSVDMKGFDAVAMHVMRDIDKDKDDEVDIALALTFDEEIGGLNGAAKMAENGYIPKLLINGDGGNNFAVTSGQKGIAKIKLSCETKPGPHPYAWDKHNALDLLLEDVDTIKKSFPGHHKANALDNWYTTYSSYDISTKNGSVFPPHYVEMMMNFYYVENISPEKFLEKLSKLVKHSTLELKVKSQPLVLNMNYPEIENYRKLMEKFYGKEVGYRAENGGSDAKFYGDKNIPIIIFKTVGEGHHTPDEYADIRYIKPMYQTLKAFIKDYSKEADHE